MRNRFEDALYIQQGACNPSGIARSLVKACDEARADGVQQRVDPAVRLIVHQLAYLVNVYEIETTPGVYEALINECNEKVNTAPARDPTKE